MEYTCNVLKRKSSGEIMYEVLYTGKDAIPLIEQFTYGGYISGEYQPWSDKPNHVYCSVEIPRMYGGPYKVKLDPGDHLIRRCNGRFVAYADNHMRLELGETEVLGQCPIYR